VTAGSDQFIAGSSPTIIYLDQNKWIDLSRARHSEQGGGAFKPALAAAERAVADGRATFPLSVAHYLETWKRYKGEPRRRVGSVMSDLSRHRTVAGQQPSPRWRLTARAAQALRDPDPPRVVEIFGYGAAHAFNEPVLAEYASWPLAAELNDQALAAVIEREMISGPVEDLPVAEIAQVNLAPAQNYARSENEQAEIFRAASSDRDEIDRVIAAAEVMSLLPVITPALKAAGVSLAQFYELGEDGMNEFMFSMPWRGAAMRLRQRRFHELHQQWTPNDLNDIAYLTLGLAYCDILVTERQWVHRICHTKLDELYGTIVTPRPARTPRPPCRLSHHVHRSRATSVVPWSARVTRDCCSVSPGVGPRSLDDWSRAPSAVVSRAERHSGGRLWA